MAKNILIFSDGTGQRGGVSFDERRSNVYKLFRATRCGPDSSVDPSEQLAFYDPGLGTLPPGSDFGTFGTIWRLFSNLASQATGLGLTGNIIDCYAAIIRMWQPGDRIFLFGFSRGAYTVRCLGGVIALCGVPTADDTELSRHTEPGSQRIAKATVKRVYQHTASRKEEGASERQKELLAQRRELARRFREKYRSADSERPDQANVYPHFIGVFDTVASLANPVSIGLLGLVAIAALAVLSLLVAALSAWAGLAPFWVSYGISLGGLITLAGIGALAANTWQRIRWEAGLPRKQRWRIFHLTEPRMKFYDTDLNPNVGFARHANSIDESRRSFERVGWGTGPVTKKTTPEWFEQVWFAGNHSDIGGSYIENESRLSDISLQWMLDAALSVGLKFDASVLQLKPDAAGTQHDEKKRSWVFRRAGKKLRAPPDDAPLHRSVLSRFALDRVLHYDVMKAYRPENLSNHEKVRHLY